MARGCGVSAKPRRYLASVVCLLFWSLAWVGDAKTQPLVTEADIIKSLRPAAQTRSFSIDRQPTHTASPSTAEGGLPGTESHQKQTQVSAQAEPPAATLGAGAAPAAVDRPQLALLIQFAINSADIQPGSFAQLDTLSNAMLSPDLGPFSFSIEGHTDASGPPSINWRLSERRALAISQYLQTRGISAQRLHPVGYGPSRPIAGMSASGPANRRVVIATRL